jgi:hypothetical protein
MKQIGSVNANDKKPLFFNPLKADILNFIALNDRGG